MTPELEKYIIDILATIDLDLPITWIFAKLFKTGYLELGDIRTLKNQDTIKIGTPYWLELRQICARGCAHCLSYDSSECDLCVIRDECTGTIGSEV
jgi:hypothetical protein